MNVSAHLCSAPDQEEFQAALVARHGVENQAKLAAARVGIAGLGGVGSAVAVHLARVGVGTLVLVDFDIVDVSNLHRQHYLPTQVGTMKTEALAAQLREMNPYLAIETHPVEVTPENAAELFEGCTIVCEAFDKPEAKAMFTEAILSGLPGTPLVASSGMAGFGSANTIRTKRALPHLYLCGDGATDVEDAGTLFSPRVGVCAGHEANMAVRLILGEREP